MLMCAAPTQTVPLCTLCVQVVEQAEARPGDYAEVYADVSKIQRDLGWRANYTDVDQGLAHAWAWRQQHPDGYLDNL